MRKTNKFFLKMIGVYIATYMFFLLFQPNAYCTIHENKLTDFFANDSRNIMLALFSASSIVVHFSTGICFLSYYSDMLAELLKKNKETTVVYCLQIGIVTNILILVEFFLPYFYMKYHLIAFTLIISFCEFLYYTFIMYCFVLYNLQTMPIKVDNETLQKKIVRNHLKILRDDVEQVLKIK